MTHDRTVSRHEAPACNRRHGTPGAALVLLAAAVHKRARDAQSATADSLRIVMWILVFARACSFVPKNCPDVPGVTFRPAHGAGSRDVAVSETAPNRHAQGGVDCRYANNDRLHEEIGPEMLAAAYCQSSEVPTDGHCWITRPRQCNLSPNRCRAGRGRLQVAMAVPAHLPGRCHRAVITALIGISIEKDMPGLQPALVFS